MDKITARFGDGSSDWDLSAHTFEFFNANNTLLASKLGSVELQDHLQIM